jgi:hypothetical protein
MEVALLKAALFEHLGRRDALVSERERHENVRLVDENEIAIRENRLQQKRVESAEFEKKLQDLHEARFAVSTTLQQHDERVAVHRAGQREPRPHRRGHRRGDPRPGARGVDRGRAVTRPMRRRAQALAARARLAKEAAPRSQSALEEARSASAPQTARPRPGARAAKEKGALEQIEATLSDLAGARTVEIDRRGLRRGDESKISPPSKRAWLRSTACSPPSRRRSIHRRAESR